MKEARTKYDLKDQIRKSKEGKKYKIISFSTSCFINFHTTWLIEYLEGGKRFYKAECEILKDKILS